MKGQNYKDFVVKMHCSEDMGVLMALLYFAILNYHTDKYTKAKN